MSVNNHQLTLKDQFIIDFRKTEMEVEDKKGSQEAIEETSLQFHHFTQDQFFSEAQNNTWK